jgi:hypothetical protein
VREHRSRIGSRWRALSSHRQALLVLVHLRRNDTFARLAAAFGIGTATAHRYVTEVIALLADLAPDLREAMRIAQRKAYVILDGTLAPIDRLSGPNDRLYFSGKHHRHGVNIQFLTGPHGELIWASPVLPGSTHDLTAARTHGIIDALTSRAIACYADKGTSEPAARSAPPASAESAASSANARSCSTGTTPRPARWASKARQPSKAGTSSGRPAAHPAA